MRRLVVLLLALVAAIGLAVSPAAADDGDNGIIGGGVQIACDLPAGLLVDAVTGSSQGSDMCDRVGSEAAKKVDQAWKAVRDSLLGDVIDTAADAAKWMIKKVLTVALLGPSLDLRATGLFGRDATLAGMLTWLGLLIATVGAMWQLARMAVTGQTKYAGQAMMGWVQNTVVSAAGVGLVALLLAAGDAMTTGLVDATFKDDGQAYETIVKTMVPAGVSNPITMLCVVAVLLLIGFIQLVMVFLRQSIIPIQCLLLPIAGAGRVGGDATRQWLPRLVTSICVVIAYKPILAIIICTGFSEFGKAQTLAEWLRGCATLVLAVLAPGPLTRIFAPFGEAVGAGMAGGGALGAVAGAASFVAGRSSKGDDGKDGGSSAQQMTPMEYAAFVEQSMGRQGGGGQGGESGRDVQAQASRNEAQVPRQAGSADAGPAAPQPGTGATGPAGQPTGAQTGAGLGAAALGIQVLDGVNNTVQGASQQIADGGNTQ
ncbi:hypothetical protein QA942_39870 [Streptomyces sp. B21-106]|uniref:hypothetical protein n=1 Tax=Streptomyces sp. B21-106 TaxID=3039418 RepID=UPI002FF422A9